jgi:hypothetical protein
MIRKQRIKFMGKAKFSSGATAADTEFAMTGVHMGCNPVH